MAPSFQYSTLAASQATILFEVDLPLVLSTLDSYDCPNDLGFLKLADVQDKAKLLATKFSTLSWAESYLTSLRHSINNARSFTNAIHSDSSLRLDSVRFGDLKRTRAKTPSEYRSNSRTLVRQLMLRRVDSIYDSMKTISEAIKVVNTMPSKRIFQNISNQQLSFDFNDEEIFTLPSDEEILEMDTNIAKQEDILKDLYREKNRRTREYTEDNPTPIGILCMSGPNSEFEITPFIRQSVGKKNQNDHSISELFQAKYNIRKVTKRIIGGNDIVVVVPKRHQIYESR